MPFRMLEIIHSDAALVAVNKPAGLTEKKVKATFFLIGKQIDLHPETARQIIRNGHELGGHSNDWKTRAFKKRKDVEEQLDQMDLAFTRIGITNLTLFRPPNGILGEANFQ
ncbi:MAG: polysaccharide deacetylase family protein [Verrucomicrobiota bacterium]|nr:polysaccharide deacetylase family protein [Verrucomicrobiota bacterium]